MIVNATAYRAMLRQLNAKKRHLSKLKLQLRQMKLEPAAIARVLRPLQQSCQEMEVLTHQHKPCRLFVQRKKVKTS